MTHINETTYEITEDMLDQLIGYFHQALTAFSDEQFADLISKDMELLAKLAELKGLPTDDSSLLLMDLD